MERFAFKIDAALKANLYKICRLCGIDNPTKVKILPSASDIIDLDEPTLCQKVFELVGFMVAHNDKMPQTMCSLCVDKINDFYEFREMCYATNDQTRKLLGLKQSEPQKLMDIKPIVKSEPQTIGKRGRKRKTDETAAQGASSSTSTKSSATEIPLNVVKNEPLSWRKKQRMQQLTLSNTEVKEEPSDIDLRSSSGRKARKASCSVCGERFESKELAEEHKSESHVPTVMRYFCNACNQSHINPSDIKAHQLWHKLSKTPYKCPRCDVNVANNYAFTRHLREHTVSTPIELLVLDRVCPLCKKTFLTNYFYNTHPCARRTRKCGGCSCALNSEVAYMRHAPYCAKMYLSHSKYIMPEVAGQEAEVRIKNENDLEVEENANSSIAHNHDVDMQPFVVLERLASPLLRASSVSNALGRSSDRVSSKKYLKRVDQLLKNTMSTLVSIKHEPEVHIDDTGPQAESEHDDEPPPCDDFHAGNDDSDDEADSVAADISTVSVKQELVDEGYERQQIKQEPLKLKLKITNNHGQLNSSIVDDDNDLQQSKSAKKKKKRKHKERNKETEAPSNQSEQPTDVTPQAAAAAEDNGIVTIKQERVDESYADSCEPQTECQPMTSIPMLQLDSSFGEANQAATETEDVKPNRLELDRLMQITHIASGVAMAEEALPPESAVEAMPSETAAIEIPANPKQNVSTKSTARKSTGRAASTSKPPPAESQLPKIVSVKSGATVPFNLIDIKPEPANRGYADEQVEWAAQGEAEHEQQRHVENNHNERNDDETSYINNLDLSNVVIKQENDLHISDVNLNGSETDSMQYNGLRESADDNDDEEDDDEGEDEDSASSADEAEENMDTFEEQEVRIYREIELPPLEDFGEISVKSPTDGAQPESRIMEQEPPLDTLTEAVQSVSDNMPTDAENSLLEQAPNGLHDTETQNTQQSKVAESTCESEMMKQEPITDAIVEQNPKAVSEEQEAATGALVEHCVSEVQKENASQELEPAGSKKMAGALLTEADGMEQKPTADALEEQNAVPQSEPLDVLQQPDFGLEQDLQSALELICIEPNSGIIDGNLLEVQSVIVADPPSMTEEIEPPLELYSSLEESQVPQLEMASEPQDSQLASTSAFSFVITSVFSQADEAVSVVDEQHVELPLPEISEESKEDIITVPKENETLAQPFFTPSSSHYNCDEEQQNVLNHELSASVQQVQIADEQQFEEEMQEQQLELEAGSSTANCSELLNNDNEETENRINEQQQQELQQEQPEQQQPQQQRCPLNDYDSNINEIAENNNNANIERELNDDANALAQENPII